MMILIRFTSDITTKAKPTRRRFLRRLADNIATALEADGIVYTLRQEWSRFFLQTSDERALQILQTVFGITSLSPVQCFPLGDLDDLVRRGFPQSIDTMPCAGTTAPATGAGTLALGIAETLSGLVLGYAVDKNAIMSIDFTGGYADMGSLIFTVGSPDRNILMGAWAQMISTFYGITSAVHGGKTNACEPGFLASNATPSPHIHPRTLRSPGR